MNPKAKSGSVLVHDVQGEIVVYDKGECRAHLLNQPVSQVWPLLDGSRSIAEVAATLGVDEDIVSLSVDQLACANLLERGEPLSLTRRATLRRVATATAAGLILPAITSIVAPLAAQAQSQFTTPVKKAAASKKA